MLQKLAAILTSLIRNKSPSNISELHQAIRGMIILILILFVTWDVRVFIMILAQSVCARHAEFFPRVRESTCSATTVLLPGLCKSRWHSINYSFGPVLSSFGHGCSMGFLLNWAQQPAARGRQAPRTTHTQSKRSLVEVLLFLCCVFFIIKLFVTVCNFRGNTTTTTTTTTAKTVSYSKLHYRVVRVSRLTIPTEKGLPQCVYASECLHQSK